MLQAASLFSAITPQAGQAMAGPGDAVVGDVFDALFAAMLEGQTEGAKGGLFGEGQTDAPEDAPQTQAPTADALAGLMSLLAPATQQVAVQVEGGETAETGDAPAKGAGGFDALRPDAEAEQPQDGKAPAAAPRPEPMPQASARAQERANPNSAVARMAAVASAVETNASPAPVEAALPPPADVSDTPPGLPPQASDTARQAVAEASRHGRPEVATETARSAKPHKTAAHETKAPPRAEAADDADDAAAAEAAPALDADAGLSFERDDVVVTKETPKEAPARASAPAATDDAAPQLATVGHEPVPTADAPKAGPATVAHLTAQIVQKLEQRTTRFDVQLEPYGLGKVDVRVEIGASGDVSAALTFENPQAAAELGRRSGELQAALEQAGFDPNRTQLSFSTGGQPQNQQAWNQQDAPAWRGRAFTNLAETDLATASPSVRRHAAGGVDVLV